MTMHVDVTTDITVMLSFLHWWVIPQYIVLMAPIAAPTTIGAQAADVPSGDEDDSASLLLDLSQCL